MCNKALMVTAVIVACAAIPVEAAAQCADPPKTRAGRCAKAHGGYCRADGVWWTHNIEAFQRCMGQQRHYRAPKTSKKK